MLPETGAFFMFIHQADLPGASDTIYTVARPFKTTLQTRCGGSSYRGVIEDLKGSYSGLIVDQFPP
jgi:hypothetical protein